MSWFDDYDDVCGTAHCPCNDCSGIYRDDEDRSYYWTSDDDAGEYVPMEIPTLVDLCVDVIAVNFEIGPKLKTMLPQDLWPRFSLDNSEDPEAIISDTALFKEADTR